MTIRYKEIDPFDWMSLKQRFFQAAVTDAQAAVDHDPSPTNVGELQERQRAFDSYTALMSNAEYVNMVIMVFGPDEACDQLIQLIPREIEYMELFIKESQGGTEDGK